jgi:predicted AlkP superfamily pyrophosphatase or phosphodiesterase
MRPLQERPSTVDLARALGAVAGAPSFEAESDVRSLARLIGEPDHLVFVLADGLGMHLVEGLGPDSFLRRNLKRQIVSVFPSSTGPALTALATGLWPAAHAVTAWFTYLQEYGLTATVLPYQERRSQKVFDPRRVDPTRVFPGAVMAPFFRRDYMALQPQRIADSVFTRYLGGGSAAQGYLSLAHAIDEIVKRIKAALGPTHTYLYWPDIDSQEHDSGAQSPLARKQVRLLDSALGRLKYELGERVTIVVSADHGQVTVPEESKFVLADGDELEEMLSVWPPSGEPRMIAFHIRTGMKATFAEVFQRRFQGAFLLISTGEAEELRLFGPAILSPVARARLGDFIAIPEGLQALGYAGEGTILRMRGFHAGLHPDEMLIPVVVA